MWCWLCCRQINSQLFPLKVPVASSPCWMALINRWSQWNTAVSCAESVHLWQEHLTGDGRRCLGYGERRNCNCNSAGSQQHQTSLVTCLNLLLSLFGRRFWSLVFWSEPAVGESAQGHEEATSYFCHKPPTFILTGRSCRPQQSHAACWMTSERIGAHSCNQIPDLIQVRNLQSWHTSDRQKQHRGLFRYPCIISFSGSTCFSLKLQPVGWRRTRGSFTALHAASPSSAQRLHHTAVNMYLWDLTLTLLTGTAARRHAQRQPRLV